MKGEKLRIIWNVISIPNILLNENKKKQIILHMCIDSTEYKYKLHLHTERRQITNNNFILRKIIRLVKILMRKMQYLNIRINQIWEGICAHRVRRPYTKSIYVSEKYIWNPWHMTCIVQQKLRCRITNIWQINNKIKRNKVWFKIIKFMKNKLSLASTVVYLLSYKGFTQVCLFVFYYFYWPFPFEQPVELLAAYAEA